MSTAKLFRNGGSQAVRLPREFNLPGREVEVRRVGRAVLLVPKDDPWADLEDVLASFTDDVFDEPREQPSQPERDPW